MEALERDRLILRLRKLAHEHFSQAEDAVKRIEARLDARYGQLLREKKRRARETRIFADVARALFLDPEYMNATEFVVPADSKGVPGYFEVVAAPGRAIPRWMHAAQKMGAYIDISAGREVGNMRGFMERAQELGYNVREGTGVGAYLRVRTEPHEDGHLTEEQVLPEIDPDAVKSFDVPQPYLLYQQLEIEMNREQDTVRHDHEWWEIGVLLLWLHVPDFDWATFGGTRTYPWRAKRGHEDFGWARFQYREVMARDTADVQSCDRLLSRVAEQLTFLATIPLVPIRREDLSPSAEDEDASEVDDEAGPSLDTPTRHNYREPSVTQIRLSLDRVRSDAEDKPYTVAAVAELYGVQVEAFQAHRRKYVARGDRPSRPWQLPPTESSTRDSGQFAEASWSREQILVVLKAWEQKHEPGSGAGFQ